MLYTKKLMINTVIQKLVNKYKPNYIITHHPYDINEDHLHVFNSANVATRPHKKNHLVDYLFTFETPSSTEWNSFQPKNQYCPNVFIEISKKELISKINAFKEYKSEVMKAFHPRSPLGLKNLAAYRGSIFSRQYAEAFCLIKSIITND
jgi:LmbE family N-acetylglucosaminyl deacetylase